MGCRNLTIRCQTSVTDLPYGMPYRNREKAENSLLTRAAQNVACVVSIAYRAATVRERSAGSLHPDLRYALSERLFFAHSINPAAAAT